MIARLLLLAVPVVLAAPTTVLGVRWVRRREIRQRRITELERSLGIGGTP